MNCAFLFKVNGKLALFDFDVHISRGKLGSQILSSGAVDIFEFFLERRALSFRQTLRS